MADLGASGVIDASAKCNAKRSSYVPDPNTQFVLRYNAVATSEDDVKASIGSDGLLTRINVSSEDKTGAIILKLVELARYIAEAAAFAEAGPTIVFDATFDPFNPVESERVRAGLAAFGCAYHLFRTNGSKIVQERGPKTQII